MRSLSNTSQLALCVCLLAAVAFVVSINFMPYPGAVVLKVVPIIALAVLAWENLRGNSRLGVLAALLFSATGDVTLELGIFLLGLGAFLLAQLIYAGMFFRRRNFSGMSLVKAALVVAMMAAISANLWPHAGEMQLPVAFYMTAIGAMGVAAALHERPSALVLAGAISFIVSDSLIGFNRFVQPFDGAREMIMVTYYLAQVLLVCGIIRAARAADSAA